MQENPRPKDYFLGLFIIFAILSLIVNIFHSYSSVFTYFLATACMILITLYPIHFIVKKFKKYCNVVNFSLFATYKVVITLWFILGIIAVSIDIFHLYEIQPFISAHFIVFTLVSAIIWLPKALIKIWVTRQDINLESYISNPIFNVDDRIPSIHEDKDHPYRLKSLTTNIQPHTMPNITFSTTIIPQDSVAQSTDLLSSYINTQHFNDTTVSIDNISTIENDLIDSVENTDNNKIENPTPIILTIKKPFTSSLKLYAKNTLPLEETETETETETELLLETRPQPSIGSILLIGDEKIKFLEYASLDNQHNATITMDRLLITSKRLIFIGKSTTIRLYLSEIINYKKENTLWFETISGNFNIYFTTNKQLVNAYNTLESLKKSI